jgi:hypothetical protein
MASVVRQKTGRDYEQAIIKNSFLSYYIAMYNTVNENLGYPQSDITADEIYDFIQDLKHEAGKSVPDITIDDINFCFYILKESGICKHVSKNWSC